MKLLITMVTWNLVIKPSFSLVMQSNSSSGADISMLLQNSGYPNPGDIPVLNRKIFKGHRVSIREHPYVVSIRRQHAHYLVGTLMSENLVITVAHPLVDVPIIELGVVSGENYSDRGRFIATVILVLIHGSFDPYTLQNDIALVRFYEEINFRYTAKSISLISPDTKIDGQIAFVTGWGRCDISGSELCLYRSSKFFPDESLDPMLRSVSFTMSTSNYFCEGYKRHEVPISGGMLCTGPAREDDSSCSCLAVPGAPLVVGARLAGLLSWGFGCGYVHDLPLIYTSMKHQARPVVETLFAWILANVLMLGKIKQDNLTQLYQITKAYLISEWFKHTRTIKPILKIRDKSMEPLEIDKTLVGLRGTVYDVRDFINNNSLRKEKQIIYADLMAAERDMVMANTRQQEETTARPFISNNITYAFQDVWFPNKNNQNKDENKY